ncbi:MAG TPA: extracellular solute-binding protein [Clostridiales bacterium]|nr:extracellular solute-binding protein [Clostridiales bacterium]
MKSKRFEFLIIIIFFLAIFLVAWINFFPAPLTDADYIQNSTPATLRVVSYSLNSELQNLEVDDFLEDNPKIKLKVETYPIDLYYSLLTSELGYSDCPDIIAVEHPALIDNLIPPAALVSLNNHMISGYQINNDLMSSNSCYLSPPTGINSYVIYCNKDILSSLGIDLINPTLEEFIQACEKIKSHKIIPITLGARSWQSVKNIVIQLTSDLASDPWQCAMDNMNLLEPYFGENAHLNDYHDSQIAFTQGSACFYFGSLNEKEKVISNCSFDLYTTNLTIDNKRTIWFDYTGMYALCMNAKNKLVALDFLNHLTNKSEHVITQDYLSSLLDLKNYEKSNYKCNWMYNENGKYFKIYVEKLKNYSP